MIWKILCSMSTNGTETSMDKSYDPEYDTKAAEVLFWVLYRQVDSRNREAIIAANGLHKWYTEMRRRAMAPSIYVKVESPEAITKLATAALVKAFRA